MPLVTEYLPNGLQLLLSCFDEERRGLMIVLLLIVLAQSLAIAFMLVSLRRKRQAEEDSRNLIEDLLHDRVQERTADLAAALTAAQRAEEVKYEILSSVGHELRTPLTVIIGLSDLAGSISTDPKQRNYIDKIAAAGRQLSGLINDLLDLSKITAGRMELVTTNFSLRELIRRCQSAVAQEAANKALQIVDRIDDQVPDALLGDPVRLQKVLVNLLGSAIKHTGEGRIDLRINLAAQKEERICLDIEVEDDGVGTIGKDIEQWLRPLSQFDTSSARKYGGTGLGLTICRYLTEMMDGDITVTSHAGGGTTFKVKVWVEQGAEVVSQSAKNEAAHAHCRSTNVLVVEDQQLNLEIVERLLLAVGIVVRTACNGREALAILTETDPAEFDLILMDVEMPEMDGFTATREIRALPKFKDIPIIAMTAHAMDHEKQIGSVAGMNDYIGKPFETEDFYRILAKWLPRIKTQAFLAPLPKPRAKDRLPPLNGIDTRAGLIRLAGNETRYRDWLMTFIDEAPGYTTQIRSALANGEQEHARKAVHAIKGRVGMLGMNNLNDIAGALEMALQRGESADDLLDKMEMAVRKMCDELQRALGTAQD